MKLIRRGASRERSFLRLSSSKSRGKSMTSPFVDVHAQSIVVFFACRYGHVRCLLGLLRLLLRS